MQIKHPDFQILKENFEATSDYCLVIPVINEGYKLTSLLEKIKNLSFNNFDILVVDGGSNDGSIERTVELDFVDYVLLRKEEGKLGTQLRCAYWFLMFEKNYKGIITIDGNNKDNPNAIEIFLKKLDEGYDFVQGSRFIDGGVSVNLPIMRYLGIKLIHKPILNLFSKYKWTDTTQGFRGYSKRFITSDKVSIFRKIFTGYELLFYLSYIGPKLDFKCTEIPTERIYPKGEVPTKISGLKSYFNIIFTLIQVKIGKFNVPE